MKQKLLFTARAIIISLVLFAAWFLLSKAYVILLSYMVSMIRGLFGADAINVKREQYSYFLIPAISIILAASGSTIKRRLTFSALAIVSLFMFDLLSLSSGFQDLVVAGRGFENNTTTAMASLLYHTFGRALPLFFILAFLSSDPSVLWKKKETETSSKSSVKRCPICGQARAGLEDHIKAVHGEKSLKSRRVRRALD